MPRKNPTPTAALSFHPVGYRRKCIAHNNFQGHFPGAPAEAARDPQVAAHQGKRGGPENGQSAPFGQGHRDEGRPVSHVIEPEPVGIEERDKPKSHISQNGPKPQDERPEGAFLHRSLLLWKRISKCYVK